MRGNFEQKIILKKCSKLTYPLFFPHLFSCLPPAKSIIPLSLFPLLSTSPPQSLLLIPHFPTPLRFYTHPLLSYGNQHINVVLSFCVKKKKKPVHDA